MRESAAGARFVEVVVDGIANRQNAGMDSMEPSGVISRAG
jgi:hypothetical protein